jgi:hypothetical protein
LGWGGRLGEERGGGEEEDRGGDRAALSGH